jgi:hypothetical protein
LIIIQKLRNNYEIDWYVPVELAYNKRFGERWMKDPKLADKKVSQKSTIFTML